MTTSPSSRRSGRDHPGPPLAAPAVVTAVTLVLGALSGPLGGDGTIPPPTAGADTVQHYFAAARTATAVGSWLLALSSVALVVFSAVAYSRLSFLAPNAPGPVIAGFGGVAAAGLLATSAASTWLLSRSEVISASSTTKAAHDLAFFTGGPLHVAALGVLVLGLAVTTLFINRTPRWLSLVGLALAAVDLLASTALLTDATVALVPIGRFTSLAWLIGLSFRLPRGRAARTVGA